MSRGSCTMSFVQMSRPEFTYPRRLKVIEVSRAQRRNALSQLFSDFLRLFRTSRRHRCGSAGWRQHILPTVVSCFPRIFDRVLGTVGRYQFTALWTVDGGGRPAGDVDAGVWLLPIAFHSPRTRPLQRIADGRRRPRHPVGRRRVEAGVDRRRGYHVAGIYRLIASRARCRAVPDLIGVAVPRVSAQRLIWFVAAAFLWRRGVFTGNIDTRKVACPAHGVGRSVLRDLAICSGRHGLQAGVRRRPPLRCREKAGQTRRGLVDRQRGVERSVARERRRYRLAFAPPCG